MAQLEIKKMKQGMSYSCKEKTIILNVFKYFRLSCPDQCVTEIVRRTAKATGCSEKSVFQFRKEEASAEGFKVPSTTKIRRNININSRDVKYDDSVRQAIRNIIYELKYKNIVPSLNTILKQISASPHLPHFSLMTLRRLMFDMGFSYEKNGNKSVLVEKPALKKESSSIKKKILKPSASNGVKSVQNVPANNVPIQPHAMNDLQQGPKLLPMQMPQQNHMIPMHIAPHSMPMMFNHRMPPPPPPPHHMTPGDMGIHLKPEMPPWMHHHPTHAMMKQE